MDRYISFVSGFVYGLTSVIVGQPLDTIKTRLQTMQSIDSTKSLNSYAVGRDIFKTEGIKGLYRGGMSLVIGGGFIRSAQFGVNSLVITKLREEYGITKEEDKVFKIFDPQVVVAGLFGGIARGVVEGPFEFIKVRRQVHESWNFTQIYKGSGATIIRNTFLFGSFVVYIDISKKVIDLSPFMLGAITSSMAWITVWPLDVAKTQLQSGQYKNKSLIYLVRDIFTKGLMFRGLMPGILRSSISNGCSMVMLKETEKFLEAKFKS